MWNDELIDFQVTKVTKLNYIGSKKNPGKVFFN